ncbi:MAG TPA: hypothetical protein VGQ79_04950 [Nitrospiraceae bacterium]|jgi:hypothetical protein|nr:hypothetical protein [Nitrospiraceae bacterium]
MKAWGLLAAVILVALNANAQAVPVDQLPDLSSSVSTVVTLKARDNFLNEFRYDVTVRNQGIEPIDSSSLILVLEQITDLAGKDALDRIEVLGQDGQTAEGKPYFRIPLGDPELAPYTDSPPAIVRLRNAAYTIIFTPSFRVRGVRRSTLKQSVETTKALIELLQKKGVLTPEDLPQVLPPPSDTQSNPRPVQP